MAKLTKMAYFCSLRGKIDFENLLVLEKTAEKPSIRTEYFSFHLISVNMEGVLGNNQGVSDFFKMPTESKIASP